MLNRSEAVSATPNSASIFSANFAETESPSRTILLLVLFLLFGLALFLRSYHLGANGISEDEANKMMATVAYRHGDFTPNGEHPMLMKSLSTVAIIFEEKWNEAVASPKISPEGALRFPVALFGAATVFAIYLFARELLNRACALIAAALWAVDVNSVALSRIAKEDIIVTCFFVLANFFLLRGKRVHFLNRAKAVRSYIACGMSYGLFFASKYLVPLPWITLIYYDLCRFRKEPRWRLDRPTLLKLYGAFFLVFLIADPVVLSPGIWLYGWKQFTLKHLTHHGYYMMDRIWINSAVHTFWGVPPYFYALYIWVKTPLALLGLLAIGIAYAVRRIKDDRFLFLCVYFFLWIFLLSLPGGKFTRYAVTLLPAIILLEALGIYILYSAVRAFLKKREFKTAGALPAILIVSILGWQLYLNAQYHPMQSLYVSQQAGGPQRWGYYFPQDDFYDAGLREAIQALCAKAPKGSSVVGTTPVAFQFYQQLYGRPDLRFIPLPAIENDFQPSGDYFFIGQDYRQYLENSDILTFLHSALNPIFVSRIKGRVSAEVYFLSRKPPYARSTYWKSSRWPELLDVIVRKASDNAL